MKKITLWLFALFTCWQMTAQTGTVLVGTNDGTPNTSFGDPSPLQDYYKTQRIQILYTASELTGAGLVAGNITEIGWVATTLNLSTLQENYSISLKSTTSAVLTSTFESGATLVYGPTDFTPSATGNIMFTLSTPFAWNGTSNLIVEVCAGLSTGVYTENVSCANSTTTAIQTVYYRSDTATSPCTQATGTTTNDRPLLVVTGSVASCLAPLNVISANVTAFSADISWDAATPTPGIGYQYVVSTSSTAPTSVGTATTNIYASLTSLLPQTTYYIFVRSNCSTGQFSGWNGPSTFTTACAPVTTFPNVETFNTFLPNQCWMNGVNGDLTSGPSAFTASGWAADGFANSGTTGAFSNNIYTTGANDWVISPQFSIPASGYELKFDAAAVQYAANIAPTTPWESDDFIEVLVSSTGTSNWTVLHTYNDTNQPGITATPISLDLDAYASQTVRFAFRAVEGSTNGNADIEFSIDNFQVRLTPSCIEPLGLLSSGITSTGASVSWDATNPIPSSGYEYVVSTSNTLPTIAGTPVTTTFAVLSGLLPNTTYYLFVRANCGSGDFSPWSASISFTTACAAVTTFTQNFDTVTTPALPSCWGKILSGATLSTFASVGTSTVNSSAPNGVDLYNSSSSATDNIMLVSPTLSNLSAGTHRLKFKARNSTATQDLEIGVLTDPTDATTFTLVQAVDITTTFQNYVVNFDGFTGPGTAIALRRLSTSTYTDVYLDDIIWEAIPTCPDQTGLIVGGISATGANTSWDDLSTNGAVGYEYAVTTSATPPTSGTATTSTFYIASGLTPQTLYYLHVRSYCGSGSYGVWVSIPFTTQCAPITSLPWNEGFEGLTTVGTSNFPPCWSKENGDWSSVDTNGTYSTSNTGTHYIRDSWSATNEYIWTPGFDLVAGTSYDFSSFVQGDNGTGWVVDYFVNTVQISTGATQIGASYNVPGAGTPYAFQPYSLVKRSFVPTTTGTYYFAVRVNQPSGGPWYVSLDDFKLELSPACPTPSASSSAVTNVSANLSWSAVPSATLGYEYVLNTVATDPTGSGTAISGITYAASALTPLTTYYFHIRSVCATGTYSSWFTVSFTTLATPPVNDNCATATVLTPGGTFAINPVVGSNVGATASSGVTTPTCDTTYTGGDVWFSVIVPSSGNITIETNSNTGSNISDTVLTVYSGTCASLTQIGCDDDSSNDGNFSKVVLTSANNIVAGQTLYVRVWDYGNNDFGTFKVSAYDASLSNESFDTSNFVAYPNPVKDVLNLSYKAVISNVKITNLLGQEVLNTKTNSSDVQVNMAALNAGVYIVNVKVDDIVHSFKVIKE